MRSHNNTQLMMYDMQFIGKISKQKDNYYLRIPTELTPAARKLHRKYVQVTLMELDGIKK